MCKNKNKEIMDKKKVEEAIIKETVAEQSMWFKFSMMALAYSNFPVVISVGCMICTVGCVLAGISGRIFLILIGIIYGMLIPYCVAFCIDIYGLLRYGYVDIRKEIIQAMMIMQNVAFLLIIERFR